VSSGAGISAPWHVFPLEAPVPQNDALAEKHAEIEYDVESAPFSRPWPCRAQKSLSRLWSAKIRDKGAAIAGTPSGNSDESGVVYFRRDIKLRKERAERGQSWIAMLHEVAEVLSPTLVEFPEGLQVSIFTLAARARGIRPWPMWQFVNRIVDHKVGHAAPLLDERSGFATQPAKHGHLLC